MRIWRTHHSNINSWMTVIIIPFWIIRIWRTQHSNINALMTVIIISFEPYAFDVRASYTPQWYECITDRYHYYIFPLFFWQTLGVQCTGFCGFVNDLWTRVRHLYFSIDTGWTKSSSDLTDTRVGWDLVAQLQRGYRSEIPSSLSKLNHLYFLW